jgi:tetraacyldisaccharide 4'-kinase
MSRSFSLRCLLLPLVPVYRLALALREVRLRVGLEKVCRLRWPVISIGNLSTGGSGKTPLAIALAQALSRRGYRVDVLSRGYGRQSQTAARVSPEGTAEEFGDEPLVIAQQTGVPVYVARQRFEAGYLAELDWEQEDRSASGTAAIHLLDDGFQHRQLYRDVNILLLDRRDWQDGLLPAGNLREPLREIRRASVIALPAGEIELERALRARGWQGPLWRLRRRMEIPAVAGPVAAFCGIARPQQFFEGLEAGGMKLCARMAFSDHHGYSEADLNRLVQAAQAAGASALVTTEKDRARLGRLAQSLPATLPLKIAGLRTEIENEASAIGWLMECLSRNSAV